MSYITVNRKDKAITKMKLRHRLFALKFSEIFKSYMVPSKILSQQINKFLILAIKSLVSS